MQAGWRWCNKCQGLIFAGHALGPCAAGGIHDCSHSGAYELLLDETPPKGQNNWRWCKKCGGLAFSGHETGLCPAGGRHDHSGSGDYTLMQGTQVSTSQPEWRWCRKCQSLAFNGHNPGPCPAGGRHDHSASGNYRINFVTSKNVTQYTYPSKLRSRLAFFQDLDWTSYLPSADPEKGSEAWAKEEKNNREGFANLAFLQATEMNGYTDRRNYEDIQPGPMGPIAFRSGKDIIETIANSHRDTGDLVDRIHFFGHSVGENGQYGDVHRKQYGLYRNKFREWRNNPLTPADERQRARLINEIPKNHLAEDVIFLLHGCKMSYGAENESFAKELFQYLASGSVPLSQARVYAHYGSPGIGANTDWVLYSHANPNGKKGVSMPYEIYHKPPANDSRIIAAISFTRSVFIR